MTFVIFGEAKQHLRAIYKAEVTMCNIKVSDYKKALRYIDRLERVIGKTQEGIKVIFNILSEIEKSLEIVIDSKNSD